MGKDITTNRKARHEFFIEDTYEAGIVLTGTEVKSLREGRINITDSYAKIEAGEVTLVNAHINEYSHGNRYNHDPLRERRLLLNKKEIKKLFIKVVERGYSLIPLKMYFKGGWVKVELGLGKGKRKYDKREDLKKSTSERDLKRFVKDRR